MNTAPTSSIHPGSPAPTGPRLHAADHAHAADLETCLDFVNTLELDDGVPRDRFPTATGALAWLDGHGLAHVHDLHTQAAGDPEAWLARVRGVREALREAWDAVVEGRAADPAAVARLNDVLTLGPHAELATGPAGVVVGHRHRPEDPTGEALARVVEPFVRSIEAGETSRFRVCANDECRWVFEDTSRGGRRRWCDMTTCGNRAKVRRFRSKRRVPASPGEAGGAGE